MYSRMVETQESPTKYLNIAAKLSPPPSSSDGPTMKSPYGRENTTPASASNANSISVNGVAYSGSYRVPTAAASNSNVNQLRAYPGSAMGASMMYGGHNSISLDGSSSSSSSRKRPLDSLSPLPSPLLSFLSTPSTGPASSPSPSNMVDLSLRFGANSAASGSDVGSNQGHATAAVNSLKFVVPVAAKRVRRESPSSPRSVGEVSSRREPSSDAVPPRPASALPPPAPSASTDKIRSVVRGLEHVSRCSPNGCGNPLCVSTRGFMSKVSAHLVTIAGKPGHQPDKCGACVLWQSIVRSHTTICMEADCSVPLCPSGQKSDVASMMESSSNNVCRRDRRDDNDDQRFPMIALK